MRPGPAGRAGRRPARTPPRPADRPAFARDHAQRREPRPDRVLALPRKRRRADLRARRDGGRGLRGRRRPGPDRGNGPAQARPRRRPVQDAARLIVAGWICLFSPLAAALAITLWGNRLSRRGAGYLATASVAVSFVAGLVTFALLLGDKPDDRSHYSTVWEWLTAGSFKAGLQILVDPLSVFMML